ncbi:hypothetical protein JCM19237_6870 [Photobacterium aphoticum]|uniref:Uncharacterized protein n=1 Tax=Photobacterium aphoticum TaxID=754436 RepID=A0A090R2V3_9GAMM|nr:hypothetical protein JCM19237_6870 [Photobacterium aphoticum]
MMQFCYDDLDQWCHHCVHFVFVDEGLIAFSSFVLHLCAIKA